MRGALLACPSQTHGLGNRIRLLLSARLLARAEDRRYLYAWPTGPAFGARLGDLWEFPETRVPARVSAALSRRYPYRGEQLDWVDGARDERLWQIMSGREVVVPEGGDWREEFRRLTPTPQIAARVAQLHSGELAAAPFVGVMIRANAVSHEQTRRHSPVEWYLERMRAMLEQQPDLRFYLSCDDEGVQARVVEQFPSTVAQVDKGPYNSRQALSAAVVDLYLLGCSAYLLGPHWSSFIHLATYLSAGTVPLETSAAPAPDWQAAGNFAVVRSPLVPGVRV